MIPARTAAPAAEASPRTALNMAARPSFLIVSRLLFAMGTPGLPRGPAPGHWSKNPAMADHPSGSAGTAGASASGCPRIRRRRGFPETRTRSGRWCACGATGPGRGSRTRSTGRSWSTGRSPPGTPGQPPPRGLPLDQTDRTDGTGGPRSPTTCGPGWSRPPRSGATRPRTSTPGPAYRARAGALCARESYALSGKCVPSSRKTAPLKSNARLHSSTIRCFSRSSAATRSSSSR